MRGVGVVSMRVLPVSSDVHPPVLNIGAAAPEDNVDGGGGSG